MEEAPGYEKALIENIRRYGFNHGLSRVNNMRLRVFEDFEQEFAARSGAEAAAVVSSGYLAGISAWQQLYPLADQVWIAPDTHPAILPVELKPDLQLDFTQWKKDCLERSEMISPQRILVLGNAVDPLRAEVHSYDWVRQLAQKHEVSLLLDDSHAFGVLGDSLYGTYSTHFDPSFQLVVSGSLGKGLAMPAGIILGNLEFISNLKARAIFTGASPGSPANLQTFLDSSEIYLNQRNKVLDRSSFFFQKIQGLSGMHGVENFPVFVYSSADRAEKLEQKGFITSSFSYPTSQSPRINRIVLSGAHSEEDVGLLISTLHQLALQ